MMTTLMRASLWLAVTLPVMSFAAPQAIPRDLRSTVIRGLVMTRDRPGVSVRNAVVELNAPGIVRRVVSDADGRFEFRDVTPASYAIRASKGGYITSEYGAVQPGGAGTRLVVSERSNTTISISIALPRGAVLAGIVRGTTGEPAPYLLVTIQDLRRSMQTLVTTTDYRGRYRVHSLLPGEYTISAKPPLTAPATFVTPAAVATIASNDSAIAALQRSYRAGTPVEPTSTAATKSARAVGYADVYYPGVADSRQATRIVLDEAEVREALDFTLLLSGTARIRGTVASSRADQPEAVVSVTAEGSSSSYSTRTVKGAFEISNVPPGHYAITAKVTSPTTSMAVRSTDLWAERDIELVGADEVQDVQLILQPAMRLAGRVVFDDKAGVPPKPLAIKLALYKEPGGVVPWSVATPNAGGTFLLAGIGPERYRLVVTVQGADSRAWRVQSVVSRGRDLLDGTMRFGQKEGSIADAVVTLTTRHSEVSGLLKGDGDRPAHYVVAFPRSRELWDAGPRRLKVTRPSTDGRFSFVDLPSGDYLVAVLSTLPPDWQSPAFLEAASVSSVAAKVQDGETVSLELQIVP